MTGFGIDLGTANTVVCHQRRGVVLDEPSVMVVRVSEARARRVRPVLLGHEARDLMGRCPVGLTAMRPLHDGVIVDLEAARAFVVGLLGKLALPAWRRIRPRAVIGCPPGQRPWSGEPSSRWPTRPDPYAGADPRTDRRGCGVRAGPLEPRAHMVLDIGGGTSEITAFCYGGVLSHRSSRIAGDEMTLALYRYLRAEHRLLVGELTAEALKCRVDTDQGLSSVVQGIDLATGRPRLLTLESEEVLEALRPTADAIIAALAGALDDLPPQAADDILTDGVTVFGGSSLLRGFDKLVESELAFPVRMAERPLTCVAEGAARCLADPDVVRAYETAFLDAA